MSFQNRLLPQTLPGAGYFGLVGSACDEIIEPVRNIADDIGFLENLFDPKLSNLRL